MTQTKKNALLVMLFAVSVVSAGAIGRATAQCPPAQVIDCPVLIGADVIDRWCPECPKAEKCKPCEVCRDPWDIDCPEAADCPPPIIRHRIEATPAAREFRLYLTPMVSEGLDHASLTARYNWPYSSRWQPVVGVLWTDGSSGPSDSYRAGRVPWRSWEPSSRDVGGEWTLMAGVSVGVW